METLLGLRGGLGVGVGSVKPSIFWVLGMESAAFLENWDCDDYDMGP